MAQLSHLSFLRTLATVELNCGRFLFSQNFTTGHILNFRLGFSPEHFNVTLRYSDKPISAETHQPWEVVAKP